MLPLTFTFSHILILEMHSLGLQKSSQMGLDKQSKSVPFNHKIQRSPILQGLEVNFNCLESCDCLKNDVCTTGVLSHDTALAQ